MASLPSKKNLNELMPSVIHGGDEFTDLTEAPSVTENGGTQAHYCIFQHRTIVGKDGEKDGGRVQKMSKLPPALTVLLIAFIIIQP